MLDFEFFIGGTRCARPIRGVFQPENLLGFLKRGPPLRIGVALTSRTVNGSSLCETSYSNRVGPRAFASEEWIGAQGSGQRDAEFKYI